MSDVPNDAFLHDVQNTDEFNIDDANVAELFALLDTAPVDSSEIQYCDMDFSDYADTCDASCNKRGVSKFRDPPPKHRKSRNAEVLDTLDVIYAKIDNIDDKTKNTEENILELFERVLAATDMMTEILHTVQNTAAKIEALDAKMLALL